MARLSRSGSGTCARSIGFLRRPPAAENYRSAGYDALGCLPAARHERGKGGEVNRNEGLRAKLRNRLGRATSGYSKKMETLAGSLALVWLGEGLI